MPAVRLAIVAGVGAWLGQALLGSKFGAALGAGGAVLLVETGAGRQLLGEGARLVREGRMPPLAEAASRPPANAPDNVLDFGRVNENDPFSPLNG